MIGAKQWEAYNKACSLVTSQAKQNTIAQIRAWLAENPNATVAEGREAAQRIAQAVLADNAQAASSLAAEWYDAEAKRAGKKLAHAVTVQASEDVGESLAKTARYQVSKLQEEGGAEAFAQAMGEWAEYQSKLVLNKTIIANARRDRKSGVRFARVTSGLNTCTFCTMLASRGAVYYSRDSAGEFSKYHTHCSCKIVPTWSKEPMTTLVYGHDPATEKQRWRLYQAIDDMVGKKSEHGMSQAQADYVKQVALRESMTAEEDHSSQLSVFKVFRSMTDEDKAELQRLASIRGKHKKAE